MVQAKAGLIYGLGRLRPTGKDVVIGVSASGITQFVFGALTRALAKFGYNALELLSEVEPEAR